MKYLLANIKMTLRNKQVLFWSVFFPIFMMGLFGAMFQGGDRTYDIGMVNKSKSETAAKMVEALKKVEVLKISEDGEESEQASLEKGERIAVIEIPETLVDPPKQVKALGVPTTPAKITPTAIDILFNENKAQDAEIVATVVNQFIGKFNQQMTGQPETLTLTKEAYKSKDLKYIDFLLPGLIAMSLMMGGVVGIANGITTLRERGVLKRLLATPINPVNFFIVQVITRLLVAIMQAIIMVAVGVLAFGAHFYGSILTFAIVLTFGATVFLIFGLVMSSLAKNVDTVEPMTRAVTMPMMFLGGVFFPIEAMPTWLQPVSRALPLSYMSDALRKVISEGVSLYTIRIDLLVLLVWGIAGFLIAARTFKWE
ncbi:hypothetical protein COY62_00595 [bacterium (Candidatus Howlettbacteria) CG_4_10_14_0_8_um_filter_40_9]|nr:MAG: hypothetical protein COY62_00595 [bacterium (Candidatus Howlettbacteria) CG_4_10_14_0_8_um_filter_40_9]